MKTDRPFLDTNVLLYLFSEDNFKADHVEVNITIGSFISVQAFNEYVLVALKSILHGLSFRLHLNFHYLELMP
jgi:predicted nucleic acid-binding protein